MKVRNIVLVAAVLLPICWLAQKRLSDQSPDNTVVIGILQTASHPALDQAREGFIQELEKLHPGRVQFIVQNAEGIVSQAQSIAASFHGNPKVKAIYAIGTPAAQAIAKIEKEKPIFIAAVTDPVQAGLMRPNGNVCGTSDRVDAKAQIAMIRKLLPLAKTVAVLYNPGETNSVAAVAAMEEAIKEAQLEVIKTGVLQHADVKTATMAAARKSDVLLVPTDNLLVAAMSTVASLAIEAKKTLVVSDPPSVGKGALACLGVDYKNAGQVTAQIALKVLLDRKPPYEIEIATTQNPPLYINKQTLNAVGLQLPQGLNHRAVEAS